MRNPILLCGVIAYSLVHCTSAYAGSPVVKIDWPTYGFDSVRSSYNNQETILSPATVGALQQVWSFSPGRYDGALTPPLSSSNALLRNQAIVASNVNVQGTLHDLVMFGDNNGSFFALDASTGAVVWATELGNTQVTIPTAETLGTIGTAALDRSANGGAGVVYASSHDSVHALDLATGHELSGWPLILVPNAQQTDGSIHSGINVVDGQLYVGTSGLSSDTAPFYGRIFLINAATATIQKTWYPIGGTSVMPKKAGGGIWGPGGVSVDPSATVGGLYTATGNSLGQTGQKPNYAEEVVNLDPALTQVVSFASPVIQFGDNDYGSTPTVFQPSGCAGKFLAVKNKTGILVLESISPAGVLTVQQVIQIGQLRGTTHYAGDFRGTVAWDPADNLLVLSSISDGPSPYVHGLHAFAFNPNCASPYLTQTWQMTTRMNGRPISVNRTALASPVVANGVAYFSAYVSSAQPALGSYVYAVATVAAAGHEAGELLWQSPTLSTCSANTAPTVVNGRLFVVCTGGAPAVRMFALPGG